MKDRIIKIMEHEGMGQAQFASAIGIQRAAMSHIISGRNNPSLDVIMKILNYFSNINPDWLLFGIGDILREDSKDLKSESLQTDVPREINLVSNSEEHNSIEDSSHTVDNNPSEKQLFIPVEKSTKTVTRILVFYSDNTYESFVPEKSKNE